MYISDEKCCINFEILISQVVYHLLDILDVQNKADPLAKVKAGLQGSNKEPVPLKSVHIRGKMLDMVAQVGLVLVCKEF